MSKWKPMMDWYRSLSQNEIQSVLEIGAGPTTNMWRELFPQAYIAVVDRDPEQLRKVGNGIVRHDGNVMNTSVLDKLAAIGPYDLIVDDGGHRPYQIYRAWKYLWPHASKYYVIEDLHLSERPHWRWMSWIYGPRRILNYCYRRQNKWLRDGELSWRMHGVHLLPTGMILNPRVCGVEVEG